MIATFFSNMFQTYLNRHMVLIEPLVHFLLAFLALRFGLTEILRSPAEISWFVLWSFYNSIVENVSVFYVYNRLEKKILKVKVTVSILYLISAI